MELDGPSRWRIKKKWTSEHFAAVAISNTRPACEPTSRHGTYIQRQRVDSADSYDQVWQSWQSNHSVTTLSAESITYPPIHSMAEVAFLNLEQEQLAYHFSSGKSPAIIFLPGYHSCMNGEKALVLEEHCISQGHAMCRFDYRGHGLSSGIFEELTLSDWIEDATTILDEVVIPNNDQVILVGSSMGGWIACHIAVQYPERIAGLVGVAAAPDFLEEIYQKSSSVVQSLWKEQGFVALSTKYGDGTPYTFSWKLLQDSRLRWNILQSDQEKIEIRCPVRLFHGKCDGDIDWKQSVRLMERLETADVLLLLVKDGDHRLSRPQDLRRLCCTIDEVMHNITLQSS